MSPTSYFMLSTPEVKRLRIVESHFVQRVTSDEHQMLPSVSALTLLNSLAGDQIKVCATYTDPQVSCSRKRTNCPETTVCVVKTE
jgi:hypothetical protein